MASKARAGIQLHIGRFTVRGVALYARTDSNKRLKPKFTLAPYFTPYFPYFTLTEARKHWDN
jgi:hypothetical protein